MRLSADEAGIVAQWSAAIAGRAEVESIATDDVVRELLQRAAKALSLAQPGP